MFLDDKELFIKAGKGGDGAVLFRHEIYVPKGGPDGGDGGRGGSVHIVGKNNLHALTHLNHVEKITAEDGKKGAHKRSTGKSGEDVDIQVPLGTVVNVLKDGEWQQAVEITEEDQRVCLAKGGNGGWGNWHFRSSVQQAPDRANPGLPGESMQIRLVLKLIADVGLVGLPNAGKSTFLSVVSAARPKIADYPFTTLEPQLGVATLPGKEHRQIVIADLPGLIEGASGGRGLGITFLKHIERTGKILHMLSSIDPLDELIKSYQVIRRELEAWSPVLAQKPELIVLTKIDALLPEEVEEKAAALTEALGRKVYCISAATHAGIEALLTDCA